MPYFLSLSFFSSFAFILPSLNCLFNRDVTNVAIVDIIRDRERRLPRYNEFRRNFRLKPIETFQDLNPDPDVAHQLSQAYNGDVEAIDLLVGQLAEEPRPQGFGFSETTNQIFIIQASRRLFADRFYQENYNAATYTEIGMKWIQQNNMKTVLARQFPQLVAKMNNSKTAFEPWLP